MPAGIEPGPDFVFWGAETTWVTFEPAPMSSPLTEMPVLQGDDTASIPEHPWDVMPLVMGTDGNDTLTGGDLGDCIDGLGGGDWISAGGGNDFIKVHGDLRASPDLPGDWVDGGAGDDTLSFDWSALPGSDGFVIASAELNERDAVWIDSPQYSLRYRNIEHVAAVGSRGADCLIGTAQGDTLDGGAGNDTLAGGGGDDVYVVDRSGDVIVEGYGGGTDLVRSQLAAYTLGENLENGQIMLAGTASLTGNAGDNVLIAGAGNNVLDGGYGIDTASYALAASAVSVNLGWTTAQATRGSGLDRLVSIENLTGSGFNDVLTGNAGANLLDGGAGADTMTGGSGADSYCVDDAGDRVIETNATAAGGIDTVYSSLAAYTLTANVENGVITGRGAARLTGNALNNTLYAGVGDNVLDGAGGVDTVSYRWGVTGTAGVTVNLGLGAGTPQATGGSGADRLFGIENLAGSLNGDTLVGNALGNALSGDAGNDVLRGGLGRDTLSGGDGADRFVFDTLTGPGNVTNVDRITDFEHGIDKIVLDDDVFTKLGVVGTSAGVRLKAGSLQIGAAADDAGDRLVYNPATGALYYDSDGSGSAAAVQIAALDMQPVAYYAALVDIPSPMPHYPALDLGDFLVVA